MTIPRVGDRSHFLGLFAATTIGALGCAAKPTDATSTPSSYVFVWAGPHASDSAMSAGHHMTNGESAAGNDFLAVLDANPASETYGKVLASKDVGVPGAMAHHTELTLPAGHPMFANDFETGQVFLLDVSNPLAPRVTTRIDSVPGYRRPHSFARLANGNVIVSLQFGNGSVAGNPGGLAEFDAEGRLLRTSSAADTAFPGARIRVNGVELLPSIDRVVTTSMPMDSEITADVIQIWRLSDLRLLHTIAVPPVPGDSVSDMPYDARALADGRTVMLNTYYCAFYRVSAVETERPRIELVHALRKPMPESCTVAIVAGHYWVIPVGTGHAVLSLDVADPARIVEVSRLPTDSTFYPHWIAADPGSDRILITGADDGDRRVLMAHLDRATGRLTWDERFRDAGSPRRGVSFDGKRWPHGAVRQAMAHGAVFGFSSGTRTAP